jgi:hypothetical protein
MEYTRLLSFLALAVVPALAGDVRIRIDASLNDAVKLVERLNDHGKEHGLQFKMADTDYQFRIATASEGMSATDAMFGTGGADASAAILGPDCKLLWIVTRGGRLSRGGAINAMSKEIVKKLATYIKATAK